MIFKQYENLDDLRKVQQLSVLLVKELNRVSEILGTPYYAYGGTAIGAVRHHGFVPWDDDVDVALLRDDYERFLAEAPALLGDEFELVNNRTDPDYPANITNLVLKGTYCVPEEFASCRFQFPIRVDLFAVDHLTDDPAKLKRQARRTWWWGRLTYLRATARPYIPFNGPKEKLVLAACALGNGALRLFHVSQRRICRNWERAATMYNDEPSSRLTDFTDRFPEKWACTREELFPLRKMPFEDTYIWVPNDYDAILTRGYGAYMELPPVEQRKNHYPSRLDFGPYKDWEPPAREDSAETADAAAATVNAEAAGAIDADANAEAAGAADSSVQA